MRVLLSLAVCLVVAGCGGVASSDRPDAEVTLLLGGPPSAEAVGVYLAVSRGFDEAEGVEIRVRRSGEAAELLPKGRVQYALLGEGDLGSDDVCVLQVADDTFLCTLRTTLEDRRSEVRAVVRTLQRGYSETVVDPESAVQAVVAASPSVDSAALSAELAGSAVRARPPEVSGPQFDGSLVARLSRD